MPSWAVGLKRNRRFSDDPFPIKTSSSPLEGAAMNHPIRYACLLAAVPLQLSAQTADQTEHVEQSAVP